ncbi:protein translation factor SUI1 homolog 2-like [Mangifera indica]|uniref:protein translation factor SUI1 homolog 2-like n=1 Tax=Mangifera indica TaxID=29780 RepID=UPI001CF99B81|nr:protein translation factor SUI1 homolog 2-like [Mangifera indica]
MVDMEGQIPSSLDPLAETKRFANSKGGYVHLRIQKRNRRKSITTIEGLNENFGYSKILKDLKKELCCNGNVVQDKNLGKVIQLQGDQRANVINFLVKEMLADKNQIKVHGFQGRGVV